MKGLAPQEMQAHMEKWSAWLAELRSDGHLETGMPLDRNGKVLRDGGAVVTDGPFTEIKEVVGGFIVINAVDYEAALALAQTCPGLEFKSFVLELRQVQTLP